jgi:hypothetical protein
MQKRKARVGVVSLGHAVYWPQFDGLKEELSKELADSGVYWGYAYMVRGNYLIGGPKRTYLVVDVWDESRGQGDHRAYRYNLLTSGSWEYKEANSAYKRVFKN